jgi:hypothetical protein
MKKTAVEIVKEFYTRMDSNDFFFASRLLCDNFILEWPQSNERIRGRENFISVNAEYPAYGRWSFTVNRIVGNEQEAVSDVSITDGVQIARAITFTTIHDGKIIKQIEYWPETYKAPENRKHLVELID